MEVFIATPTRDGRVTVPCAASIVDARMMLAAEGIFAHWHALAGCCYVDIARNKLVRDFLASSATDLVWVDDDIGFDPAAMLRLVKYPHDIVGGAPPYKRDDLDFPSCWYTDEQGYPLVDAATGLIEAKMIGTGFLRIKRSAFEALMPLAEEIIEMDREGKEFTRYREFYSCPRHGSTKWGEDTWFCELWRSIGGRMWIDPNIDFIHSGFQDWRGNLHEWLLRRPGGSESRSPIPPERRAA